MENGRKVIVLAAAVIGASICVVLFGPDSISARSPTAEHVLASKISNSNQIASRPAFAATQVAADLPIPKTAENSKPTRPCLSDQISILDFSGATTLLCANDHWQGRDGPIHLFEFSDPAVSGDYLRLRAFNGMLISIKYLKTSVGEYKCLNQECVGASISKPDREGSVVIDLSGTILRPSKPVSGAAKLADMRIDATLRSHSAQTCADSGLTIDYSDGSSASFCSDRTGMETINPNEEVYTFSSAEGETIAVTPGAGNSVKKVGIRSNSFQCSNGNCGGVSISLPRSTGEKTINFAGTMLQDRGDSLGGVSNRTAILSGTLRTLAGEN